MQTAHHQLRPPLVTGAPSVQLAGPMLVAVVGPPGAGKSTVVAALAMGPDVPVFRLRETIRARPELLADLGSSTDPLGWVSLEAVRPVLHATFLTDEFGLGCAVVLLDNFPGTAAQLDLLDETATTTAARVALLELRADADTVVTRVAQRRVCVTCGSDSHAPAATEPGRRPAARRRANVMGSTIELPSVSPGRGGHRWHDFGHKKDPTVSLWFPG